MRERTARRGPATVRPPTSATATQPPETEAQPEHDWEYARGGMFRSLRHRDYRLFWIGLGLALAGFQAQRVALSFLAYKLTGSALYLTLVFSGDSLPMLLLAPLGGVVVDRVNRRTLLIVTRALLAALALVVAVLVLAGWIEAWHLLLFALATGALYSFDIPTRQAAIRDLVPEEDFVNAVALSSTVIQGTRIVGPAVGGLALATIGAGGAFVIMAAGNLGLVLLLLAMHLPHTPSVRGTSALANLRDGFRFIARREDIWAMMVIAALPTMFAMSYQSLTPVFAQDVLGQGKGAIGIMLTAAGIGALIGSAWVAGRGERMGGSRMAALSAIGVSLLVVLFALSRNYLLSLVLLVVIGAVGALYSVLNSTLVQTRTPRDMQGRVMGVYQLTWNVQFFGALLVGALADAAGAPAALALIGVLSAASVGAMMVLRPSLRERTAG